MKRSNSTLLVITAKDSFINRGYQAEQEQYVLERKEPRLGFDLKFGRSREANARIKLPEVLENKDLEKLQKLKLYTKNDL